MSAGQVLIANAFDNNRRFDFNSKDAMIDRGGEQGDEMRTTSIVQKGKRYGTLPGNPRFHKGLVNIQFVINLSYPLGRLLTVSHQVKFSRIILRSTGFEPEQPEGKSNYRLRCFSCLKSLTLHFAIIPSFFLTNRFSLVQSTPHRAACPLILPRTFVERCES